jgi:hypothetical protein
VTETLAQRILPAGLSVPELIGKSALFGVAGWAMHNTLFEPRGLAVTVADDDETHKPPSRAVLVPFLPAYAVGGAAVMLTAPALAPWPWPFRAAAYGAGLTALEYAVCQIDRKWLGAKSWDYGGGSCVDWKHALAWAALGMVAERFANVRPRDPGVPVPRGQYRR